MARLLSDEEILAAGRPEPEPAPVDPPTGLEDLQAFRVERRMQRPRPEQPPPVDPVSEEEIVGPGPPDEIVGPGPPDEIRPGQAALAGVYHSFPGMVSRATVDRLVGLAFPEFIEEYQAKYEGFQPSGGAEEFLMSAGGFAAEAPTLFAPAGRIASRALASAVGRRYLGRAASKDLSRRQLARLYGTEVLRDVSNAGLGGRIAVRSAQSAGMFGIADAAREAMTQYTHDYFDPGEIAHAGLHGTLAGATLGPASATLKRAALRLPAEAASLSVAGAALEGRAPTFQDFGSNLVLFTMLHGLHRGPGRFVTALQRLPQMRGALKSFRRGWRDGAIARQADPAVIEKITEAVESASRGEARYIDFVRFVDGDSWRALKDAQAAVDEARGLVARQPIAANRSRLAEAEKGLTEAHESLQRQVGEFAREWREMVDRGRTAEITREQAIKEGELWQQVLSAENAEIRELGGGRAFVRPMQRILEQREARRQAFEMELETQRERGRAMAEAMRPREPGEAEPEPTLEDMPTWIEPAARRHVRETLIAAGFSNKARKAMSWQQMAWEYFRATGRVPPDTAPEEAAPLLPAPRRREPRAAPEAAEAPPEAAEAPREARGPGERPVEPERPTAEREEPIPEERPPVTEAELDQMLEAEVDAMLREEVGRRERPTEEPRAEEPRDPLMELEAIRAEASRLGEGNVEDMATEAIEMLEGRREPPEYMRPEALREAVDDARALKEGPQRIEEFQRDRTVPRELREKEGPETWTPEEMERLGWEDQRRGAEREWLPRFLRALEEQGEFPPAELASAYERGAEAGRRQARPPMGETEPAERPARPPREPRREERPRPERPEREGLLNAEEQAQADAAWKELKDALKKVKAVGPLGPLVDPAVVKPLAKLAVIYLRATVRQLGRVARAAWDRAMRATVKEHTGHDLSREQLDYLWERPAMRRAREHFEKEVSGGRPTRPPREEGKQEGQPQPPRGPPAAPEPTEGPKQPEAPGGVGPRQPVGGGRPGRGARPSRRPPRGARPDEVPRPREDQRVGEPPPGIPRDPERNVRLAEAPPVELTPARRREVNARVRELVAKNPKPEDLTPEDRELLRQYTGSGGAKEGDVEGALWEHYTSYKWSSWIWDKLGRMGWKGRRVLDPATGSGNFIGFKPENARVTGVELEPVSAKVAKLLYPEDTILQQGFESFRRPGNFDLVIANPPYAEVWPNRYTEGTEPYRNIETIHDFFIAKSIDQLKPGGTGVFVVSTGFLDGTGAKKTWMRQELAKKARLITAYRLPAGEFAKNTQFEGTVDIVFFQRVPDVADAQWINSRVRPETGSKVNDWIWNHRLTNVFGEMEGGYRARHKEQTGVRRDYRTDSLIQKALEDGVKIPEVPKEQTEVTEGTVPDIPEPPKKQRPPGSIELNNEAEGVYPGTHILRNNRVYVADQGFAAPYTGQVPDRVARASYIGQTVREIISLGQQGKMSEQASRQSELRMELEKWWRQHKQWPRDDATLMRIFANDPNKYLIRELVTERETFSDLVTKPFRGNAYAPDPVNYSDFTQTALEVERRDGALTSERFLELYKGDRFTSVEQVQRELERRDEWNKTRHGYVHDRFYLYGDLWPKIREAESFGLTRQAEKLREVLPPQVSSEEVVSQKADLSVKWIDPEVVQRFVRKASYGEYKVHRVGDRWYRQEGSKWRVDRIMGLSTEFRVEPTEENVELYGNLADGKPHHIITWNKLIMGRLNNATWKTVAPTEDSPGRDIFTARAMNELSARADEAFRRYLRENPQDSLELARQYNENFRSFRNKTYPRELEIDNFSTHHFQSVAPWQAEFVNMAMELGRGTNATDTGGGKTLAGILLIQKLRQTGRARKPVVAVPAATLENWKKETQLAFPGSRVLDLGNLSAARTAKGWHLSMDKLARLRAHDWDVAFVTHEGLERLELSPKTQARFVSEKIEDLKVALAQAKGNKVSQRDILIRIARWKQKLAKLQEKARKKGKLKTLYFEDLGIDAIMVDEAHKFKNVDQPGSRSAGELGMSSKEVARAFDMEMKTRYVLDQNGGRNVYFLTATPTPNAPIEVYTMLNHQIPDILRRHGWRTLDEFMDNFAEKELRMAVGIGGDPKPKTVLSTFKNLGDLREVFHRYIFFKNRQKLREDYPEFRYVEPRPRHERILIEPPSPVRAQIGNLRKELSEIEKLPIKERMKAKGRVLMKARKAAVGPGIMDRALEDYEDPGHKLVAVTDKVAANYNRLSRQPRIVDGVNLNGHLIFLDLYGGSSAEPANRMRRNYHQRAKERLVKLGVPVEEIAIINSENNASSEAKQAISEKFNAGKIRVVIGSTLSMGEGMNLQRIGTHLYNWDIPWNPDLKRQREGRIVRQGNPGDEVVIYDFLMRDTYDARMAQLNVQKGDFLAEIYYGSKDRMKNPALSGVENVSLRDLLSDLQPPLYRRVLNDRAFEHDMARAEEIRTRKQLETVNDQTVKVKDEIAERRERLTEYRRRQAESKTEGAFQSGIDRETSKIQELESVIEKFRSDANEYNRQLAEAQAATTQARVRMENAQSIREIVETEGRSYFDAVQIHDLRSNGASVPREFSVDMLSKEIERIANQARTHSVEKMSALGAAQALQRGNVALSAVAANHAEGFPVVKEAWRQLYGPWPKFSGPRPESVGAAARSESAEELERKRQDQELWLKEHAQWVLRQAREMEIELSGETRKQLEELAGKKVRPRKFPDTAVEIPREGKDLTDAEIAALARHGPVSLEKHRKLGRRGMTQEEFEGLNRGEKLVHLTRDVQSAKHPAHIANILATEKYKAWKMPREDFEALVTVVAKRMETEDPAGWPRALQRAVKAIEFGERPGTATRVPISEGQTMKWVWGHMPARTALKNTGIVERLRLAWEGLKREWNLANEHDRLLYVDDKGKEIRKYTRDSRVLWWMLENAEGDPRHLDRPVIEIRNPATYEVEERLELPKDHYLRPIAKDMREEYEDYRVRQNRTREQSRQYYITHILDRVLAFEQATEKDRAKIFALARMNLAKGEYDSKWLNQKLPADMSRAKALQIIDSLSGSRPPKTKKQLNRRIDIMLSADEVSGLPTELYQPKLKRRRGARPVIDDALLSMELYRRYALRKIHLEPEVEAVKPAIEAMHGKGHSILFGTGMTQREYAERYVDSILGRPHRVDLSLEAWLEQVNSTFHGAPMKIPVMRRLFSPRPATRASSMLLRMQYVRLLGLSLRSAVTNLTQIINNVARFGPRLTMQGYLDFITNRRIPGTGQRVWDLVRSEHLMEEFKPFFTGPTPFYREPIGRLERFVLSPFRAAELINRGATFAAGLEEARRLGLDFSSAVELGQSNQSRYLYERMPEEYRKARFTSEAIVHAKAAVIHTQFGYSPIESSPLMRTPGGRMFLQFWSYPTQQMAFFWDGLVDNPRFSTPWMRYMALLGFMTMGANLAGRAMGQDVSSLWSFWGVLPWGPGPNVQAAYDIWRASAGDWTAREKLKRDYPLRYGGIRSVRDYATKDPIYWALPWRPLPPARTGRQVQNLAGNTAP